MMPCGRRQLLLKTGLVLAWLYPLTQFALYLATQNMPSTDPAGNFPSLGDRSSSVLSSGIPKIIHQTWDSEHIPATFQSWMLSWLKKNPDWEYWFWTEADVRSLVSKHYPGFLATYNALPDALFRSDAMRYFVLHKYGGLYADLDVEALKPIDSLLDPLGSCVLSLEPHEHANFIYDLAIPYVMTTIMACKPKHPFFAAVIQRLPSSLGEKDPVKATGPVFLNSVYLDFIKTPDSMIPENHIAVLEPKFLLPTFDNDWKHILKSVCGSNFVNKLDQYKQRTCKKQIAQGWKNVPVDESYSVHYWFHVMAQPADWKYMDNVHVDTFIPHRKTLWKVI